MATIRLKDVNNACKLLIKDQQFGRALQVFESVVPLLDGSEDWSIVFELLESIPEYVRLESSEFSLFYAQALVRTKQYEKLFDFCDRVLREFGNARAASVQVELAGLLSLMNRHLESRKILESAIPHLQGELLGLAWGKLGLALFEFNEPWNEAFQKARILLSGVELGKALLNEGGCFVRNNQNAEARNSWLEALPCFQSHPRLLAWTHYNLGISALRDLAPEAEHHFLEGVRLTKNPKAASMQAAILNGLGASRRVLGEWSRAEFSYRHALQIASDLSDREESHLGLARTLRLAGRPTEALETLELALHIYDTETPIVNVGRALAFLALNDTTHAKTALERVGTLVSVSDQWLYRIASAELARREGRLTDAVNLLEGLPVHSLHPREEVRQWSKLFELLALADQPVPLPLEYVTFMVVRVQAQGALRVAVNGRGVQLVPTHRPGELLVFLLENDGVASLDQIRDALYPDAVDGKDKERTQKSIWKLVDVLRHALGWESAVLSLRGAYQLDPNVTWDYDIAQARASGVFHGEFLQGVYSNWAIETGQFLAELKPDPREYRPLN